jgi:hypothetical protein
MQHLPSHAKVCESFKNLLNGGLIMSDITAKYLEEHRHSLHTPESWGRALAERVLEAAINKIGSGAGPVDIDMKFTVKAYDPLGCVQICAVYNGVQVCYHVNT